MNKTFLRIEIYYEGVTHIAITASDRTIYQRHVKVRNRRL
jgi:hypothetical protein